jgi:anti-sigma regulatory factor (Ser/Thr protein kinase)
MNVTNRRRARRSGRLDRVYDGTSSTLQSARNDVVAWLRDFGLDEDVQQRAALVISELATNAVQASPGSAYIVRGTLGHDGSDGADRDSVVLTVVSHTSFEQPPPKEHWGPSAVLAGRGRGLMIVDDLSTDVTVDVPTHGTVVVTATLRAARR